MLRKELRELIPNCKFMQKYEKDGLKIFKKMMNQIKSEDTNSDSDEVDQIYGNLDLDEFETEKSENLKEKSSTLSKLREERIMREKLRNTDKKIELIRQKEIESVSKIRENSNHAEIGNLIEKIISSNGDNIENLTNDLKNICFKNSDIYQSKRIQKILSEHKNKNSDQIYTQNKNEKNEIKQFKGSQNYIFFILFIFY